MPESSNKGGRKPRVADADLLDVFRATTDPVLSTAEVADAVPIKRRGVLNRLRDLEDAGELESKQIGGRNTVWWLRDDTPAESDREPGVTPSPAPADRSGPGATDGREDTPGGDEDGADAVDALDLPGSGGKLDARRDAIRRMYDALREHAGEPVGKGTLLALVDADAVGYASDESFWTNCVKANASAGRDHALVALPGVEDWGGGEYRYTPPEA